MQTKFTFFTAFFLITVSSFSQTGIITGKIMDGSNNQPLTRATVSIKNLNKKVLSDVDGVYHIGNLASGKYTIEVSYVGYALKNISDVEVVNGQETSLNITLETAQNTTLNTVVVTTTEAHKESLNSILTTRRNAAVVSDAISADMIKRSPDKNIGEVLRRVSGTSIQENKFVVVRGMNDRYNEALLNGALLPSTEADRKTFAFDVFPADVVDNITIIKSASPEYPGSFAGGLIIVNLKDVPSKSFLSVKAGFGYNTITTGEVYYHDIKGSSDWIGLDDGTRGIPVNTSTEKYNDHGPKAQTSIAQRYPNDWGLVKDKFPINNSLQISGGFSSTSKKGYPRIGGIFGLSYNSTYTFSENDLNSYLYSAGTPDSSARKAVQYSFKDSSYSHNILASGLANFAFKLNPNNKLFFNNLYTINSLFQTTVRNGVSAFFSGDTLPYYGHAHFFQSNQIYNGQLGGEHFLSKLNLKIKWLGYLTEYKRDEPDYRQMAYFTPYPGAPLQAIIPSPTLASTIGSGVRFYWNTEDHTKGLNLDFSKPFKLFKNSQTTKFGFNYYYDKRLRTGRFQNISTSPKFDQSLWYLPPSTIFDTSNYNPKTGFILTDWDQPQWYYYDGINKNVAGYLMLDNKLTSNLRLAWGVRYEVYKNVVNSYKAKDAPFKVDTTFHDLLPSANLIYSVLPKANIRASYSRTVARPLYRELAATQYYDFFQNAVLYGTNLSETHIDNYEVRWEQYFANTQYYSVSFYYKKFTDPIEQKIVIYGADSKTLTWQNAPSAENYGAEIEVRKNFDFISSSLKDLFFYTNAAYIYSIAYVKGNGSDTANRPLQGQSPYVLNLSLQYTEPNTGIGLSVLYNRIGPRIVLVGGLENPNIWEQPHGVLDVKLSKDFLKKGIVDLTLSDILHKQDVQFWNLNNDKKYTKNSISDVVLQSRSFGMVATLSVAYRF